MKKVVKIMIKKLFTNVTLLLYYINKIVNPDTTDESTLIFYKERCNYYLNEVNNSVINIMNGDE